MATDGASPGWEQWVADERDASVTADALVTAPLDVIGQLVDASNASLLCYLESVGGADASEDSRQKVIYKPQAGERPLWDYPEGTLSQREVAASLVAETLGWSIVPPTVWREGPFGPGMVQTWIDADPTVDIVALVQSDHPALRRIAVFDALINNSDRKGGHLLPDAAGAIWGIDHGVTFAQEPKLRTVLWQWRGEPIPDHLVTDLRRWLSQLSVGAPSRSQLSTLLDESEIESLVARAEHLIESGVHPEPSPDWPAIPWPPF